MNYAKMIQFVLVAIFLVGCSGLKPKPVYKTKNPSDKAKANVDPEPTESLNEGLVNTSIERENMMSEIENLLGVPYRFGGTSPNGMDCSGFVQYVFKNAIGYALPRQVLSMVEMGQPVARDQLKFGDLVFFNKIEDKGTSHVGIYVDSNQFVHASVSKGVIFSGLDESYYKSRYVTARRITAY